MTTTMDTVGAFYEAFGSKDFDKLRSLLADDFTFKGPLMSFDAPDAFVTAIREMPFEGNPEDSRFIVDGNSVAHAFVWMISAPAKAEIPMCEVLEVEGGKVRSSELFYDSKLLPEAG